LCSFCTSRKSQGPRERPSIVFRSALNHWRVRAVDNAERTATSTCTWISPRHNSFVFIPPIWYFTCHCRLSAVQATYLVWRRTASTVRFYLSSYSPVCRVRLHPRVRPFRMLLSKRRGDRTPRWLRRISPFIRNSLIHGQPMRSFVQRARTPNQ